jgi:hypothetical protein
MCIHILMCWVAYAVFCCTAADVAFGCSGSHGWVVVWPADTWAQPRPFLQVLGLWLYAMVCLLCKAQGTSAVLQYSSTIV